MQGDFDISPIVKDDVATVGDMLFRSKLKLTINRLLWKGWPNEAAQRPQYTSSVEGALNDATIESFKVIDNSTHKIVGYVALARKQPSEPSSQDKRDSMIQQLPDAIDRGVCKMVFEAVDEIGDEWSSRDRYGMAAPLANITWSDILIELVFILVEGPYRRKGIGSELMRRCFEKAKAASLPLVVCSEPAAHAFFAELGCRDVKHVDMDLSKWAPPFTGFGAFRLSGMTWSDDSSGS